MIDLTPLDVRKKRGDFRRILRGYDPEEVDTFMELVAERFEELVRENLALSDKTDRIESQLDGLIAREKAVQEALVTAQKLREDVKDQSHRDADVMHAQASREAELLKAEADAEIARRLGEADGLIKERRRALEDLERSRLKFLKSFRGLLERELDAVEVEESRRPLEDIPLELELRGWMSGGWEGDLEEGGEGDDDSVGGGGDLVDDPVGGEDDLVEAGVDHADSHGDGVEINEVVTGPFDDAETDAAEVESTLEAPEDFFERTEFVEEKPSAEGGSFDGADEENEVWEGSEDEESVVEGAEANFVTADLGEELEDGNDGKFGKDGEGVPGGFETQILEGSRPAGLGDDPEAPSFSQGGKSSSSTQEPKWLFSLLKKEEEERGGEG